MGDEEPKPGHVQRLKGWFLTRSRRSQVAVISAAALLGLCVIGGLAGGGRGDKRTSVGNGTRPGTTVGSGEISEDDLKGIYNGIADEQFQKIIGKLGRPALSNRQVPAPRFSCQCMAAWKKRDGTYLYLWWLESTDPRNGSKSVANYRSFDNLTLGQVETNWKMLSK